ncbi:hypothetical protein HPB50_018749 [Hyalomma asiaticum]|uniref:Uncharacterized protein n=1 Tax=Hyalomma asiaticum TaxID=266040 RepID=A0ACB7S4W5_HYAAI|nr:hypothetical protein HPB50_018749 [Hyalomma asiaticum]
MHPSPRIGASSPEPQRVAPNELTPVHQRSSRRLRATLRLEFSKDLASSIETMHCWKGDNAAIYVQVTRASYFLRAARACFSRSTEVRANRAGLKEKKRRCASLSKHYRKTTGVMTEDDALTMSGESCTSTPSVDLYQRKSFLSSNTRDNATIKVV